MKIAHYSATGESKMKEIITQFQYNPVAESPICCRPQLPSLASLAVMTLPTPLVYAHPTRHPPHLSIVISPSTCANAA